MEFGIKVVAEKSGVDAKLKAYGTVMRDFTPFLTGELDLLRAATKRRFETQGADVGGWAPLSPRYAAWKARRYPGQPILVATGELRHTLVNDGADGQIAEVRPLELRYGTQHKAARFHQFGTSRMTARRVLALDEAATAGMAERLMRFIRGQVEGAGA